MKLVTLRSAGRWCGRRDSNPHASRRWNLNPLRLPIPPRPQLAPAQERASGSYRQAPLYSNGSAGMQQKKWGKVCSRRPQPSLAPKSRSISALAGGPPHTYKEVRNRKDLMPITRRALLASALLTPVPARARLREPTVLDLRPGKQRLAPDPTPKTDVWAINGPPIPPVFRAKQGEEISFRLINNLSQPTALHWQGLRIANAMDGAVGLTQAPVAPGGSMDIRFTPPDAGTYWCRPSAFPQAAEQKSRGVYALLIVDGPNDPLVDHDLVAVIDDWRLDEGGQIRGPFPSPADMVGEARTGTLITVNGRAMPQFVTAAPGARIRLRILNACSARFMGLGFEGLRPLVVGVDGQSCAPFEPARMTLPSGPGSRFDVIFDMPVEVGVAPALTLRGAGLLSDSAGPPARTLVAFKTEGEPLQARGTILSQQSPALPAVIKLQTAKRLDLLMEAGKSVDPLRAWTFNGVAFHGSDTPALFKVKRGQPVTLGFLNKTVVAHTAHVHGHAMRVLHLLDDGWEPYWRDSVIVPPGGTVRIAFVADNPGKWLIESTIIDYAMSGLTAWFEVG